MKRYELKHEYTAMSGRCPDVLMEESTDGEWVKYHDLSVSVIQALHIIEAWKAFMKVYEVSYETMDNK